MRLLDILIQDNKCYNDNNNDMIEDNIYDQGCILAADSKYCIK